MVLNQKIIKKYFSGQCSDEELDKILDWFLTTEGQAFLREQIRNDFRRLTQEPVLFIYPDVATEKVFTRIQRSKKNNQEETSS